MKQSEVFLAGEGEAWLNRNKNRLSKKDDPVIAALDRYSISPAKVLEVGCASGARLLKLREKIKCEIRGIDPFVPPRADAFLEKGVASNLVYKDGTFDAVIYGWCLYLCDPEDYLRIAMEGDRVLKDGGYLIVYDFHADYPHKLPYKHKKELFSYHYDFAKLWLSHPAYSLYGRTLQETTSVTILHKDLKNAFPVQK